MLLGWMVSKQGKPFWWIPCWWVGWLVNKANLEKKSLPTSVDKTSRVSCFGRPSVAGSLNSLLRSSSCLVRAGEGGKSSNLTRTTTGPAGGHTFNRGRGSASIQFSATLPSLPPQCSSRGRSKEQTTLPGTKKEHEKTTQWIPLVFPVWFSWLPIDVARKIDPLGKRRNICPPESLQGPQVRHVAFTLGKPMRKAQGARGSFYADFLLGFPGEKKHKKRI